MAHPPVAAAAATRLRAATLAMSFSVHRQASMPSRACSAAVTSAMS
jgi:hypothetical protein